MVKVKVLVTGAGGLLGSAVASLASERHQVYAAFSQHSAAIGTPVRLDLLDGEGLSNAVSNAKPDAIVHSAAMTDVDKCEREHKRAEMINVEGTRLLSEAAKKAGAYFLYISTDYVFDGQRGMYNERDAANPINFYGLTKFRGEQLVEVSGADFCIARTSTIYGVRPAAEKVNFALWLVENLRKRERVHVLEDQYVSPTLNTSLARMLLEAAERRLPGTFHMSGASRVSRYEFAKAIAEAFGLDSSLIAPTRMSEMKWLARRPRDSSLDVSKAASALKEKPIQLPEAMLRLKQAMTGAGA